MLVTSRRAILAGIAAAPALAAPSLAVSAIQGIAEKDPIFAAIERHKGAELEISAAIRAHSDLEKTLPETLQQTHLTAWSQEIVTTDDPRWIAAEKWVHDAFEAGDDRACDLLNIKPTTLAGVAALAQYAFEFVARGREWPDRLADEEVTGKASRFAPETYDWSHFLHRHLAATVRELAGKST